MKSKHFYSHGKLLISGEYVVLDGAKALALPTKFGQSLDVKTHNESLIKWKSYDHNGNIWFQDIFEYRDNQVFSLHNNEASKRLEQILNAAMQLNPEFLKTQDGLRIETSLTFPTNWGLGTSSTLINNIGQWAKVNSYELLSNTFGGSGYDIACAQNNSAITYRIENNLPIVNKVNFNPSFIQHLYFIHLNKKQNSRDGIASYQSKKENISDVLPDINEITAKMIEAETLEEFEKLVAKHEVLIANVTNQTPVKSLLFNDFKGQIKSLGAWGGDFVLATSKEDPRSYFHAKGFKTVIPFTDMIL
ncbi:GYDIA family GHMP kinase [Cognatitamlana onchidii]|uniref:GYDIA family GHMP kinase n=1 Tax=Cognatitamlana onchidii TaxID=2562860 RepID=UPI0010A5BC61|nr:GYDIA family GHMP kinase [Algibacter onchidii]